MVSLSEINGKSTHNEVQTHRNTPIDFDSTPDNSIYLSRIQKERRALTENSYHRELPESSNRWISPTNPGDFIDTAPMEQLSLIYLG
jgi:hypothetical protein